MAQSKAKETNKPQRPENPYGNQPRVEPEDLGPAGQAIATISKVEWVNMASAERAEDGEQDMKLVLAYAEFPKKQHVLNKTSYRVLESKLPKVSHESEWVGQRVPLVVANTTDVRTGEAVEKVWIASLKKYDAIMAKDRKVAKR